MADESNNTNQGGGIQILSTPTDNSGVSSVPGGGGNNNEPNIFSDIFAEEMGLEPNAGGTTDKISTDTVQNPPVVNQTTQTVATPPVAETPPVIIPPVAETPEQIAARQAQIVEQNRQYEAYLDQVYAIPDEVKVHFTPEQITAQQQAMKHVHKQVKQEVLAIIQQAVPHVFQQQFQQMQQGTQVEQKFKTEFSKLDLNNETHAAAIRTAGAFVNSMNPKYTIEQRLKAIGTLCYAQLGLTNDAASNQQNTPPSRTTQFPNVRSMGGGVVSGPTNPNSQSDNPFTSIFNDFKEEGLV